MQSFADPNRREDECDVGIFEMMQSSFEESGSNEIVGKQNFTVDAASFLEAALPVSDRADVGVISENTNA